MNSNSNQSNKSRKKMPVGIMSKKMHRQNRACELVEAIQRYLKAGERPNEEWIDELWDLKEYIVREDDNDE